MRTLGSYRKKESAEAALKNNFLPADPDAKIEKEGELWIIKAKAIMSSQPIIAKK